MHPFFRTPRAEFSPLPFWFWNDELTEAEIDRQMCAFKEKGVDGFVIHPRKGLPKSIPYLGEQYLHFVRYAVSRAKSLSMTVVLYDEAMYPSGSCHGEVVRQNPAFASQGLRLRRAREERMERGEQLVASVSRDGETWLLVQVPSQGTIRGVHAGEDDGEPNAPKSADLLNPLAVASFIALTHERYYAALSEHFGATVTAFFTDEPNILGRNARADVIPWSGGIYEACCAQGLSADDIYLLLRAPQSLSASDRARRTEAQRRYRHVIHERLSESYYRPLADWCERHHIALTGHPEKSCDIGYLRHFHIPCQDIVLRFVAPDEGTALVGEHSTMGKCSADSARHHGKRRNGNECFGCCGARDDPHRFTREDMLWYINWLFVRGVNLLYPHAFYYSVRDGRGDERPPEVGMRSAFWNDYKQLSDYIKRMCAFNTDCVNHAQIAVLCGEDELSWQIAKPLFEHQLEFNYLEADLLDDCTFADGECRIARQRYRVIICDRPYDAHTEQRLKDFAADGGTVLRYNGDASAAEPAPTAASFAVCVADESELLARISALCPPVLQVTPAAPDLRCSRLSKCDQQYIVLANEGTAPIRAHVTSPGAAISEVYDALTDTVQSCSGGSLFLELAPFESRVLFLAPTHGTQASV